MNAAEAYLREHPAAPVWRSQPRQSVFLKAAEFEVLYGGAAGGGKTDALLVCGLEWVRRYGAQVLFLRRTYPDLSMPGGAIPRSHELYHGHGGWNGSEHKWSFPNGGTVQFGHLENATSHMNYRGAQIDLLLWDELTQATLEQYLFLRSRVRPTKDGVVTAIRAATNPGDVGHVWVKKRWVDAAPWGEPFHVRAEGAEPVTARFIPAKLDDNPALLNRDQGYRDRLKELPDHLRRAYEDGDWDIYEGQFFDEWSREQHVCKPFTIPPHWVRWTSTDYGYADPFCHLAFARSPATRRVYVYREMYETKVYDDRQAGMIAAAVKAERENLKIEDPGVRLYAAHFADPSMFNKRGETNQPSIADVYAAGGVPLLRAGNDRKSGWAIVRRALRWDAEKAPRLQIFDTCVNLIRTLPGLPRDPLDPEDVADVIRGQKTEDHAADALRYGLVAEAMPPTPGVRMAVIGG